MNFEMKLDQYLVPLASEERLIREYEKHGSLCIGFDFDGTVHDFHKIGATYDMVIALLRELKAIGCKLICWTAYRNHEYVIKYLTDNNIPFDGINIDGIDLGYETRKPFFNALLDDRAGLEQVYYELKRLVLYVELKKLETDDKRDSSTLTVNS